MDSDSLPIDWSHPAVKEYLSLIRLQVLTPLSLLINIATVLVCAAVVNPSIGEVAKQHRTSISPRSSLIAAYLVAVYVGQLGYCFLLVLARKPETKKTLVKGVGFALVLANWVMAAWAVTWVFKLFIASTVFLGILVVLLVYSNIALLVYHPPTKARPLDTALIHAPMRFFLILPLSLMLPYALFVTLGLSYDASAHPGAYDNHPWPGFGVAFGTNLIGLIVVLARRDVVWTVAATWLCVAVWSQRPKPSPVYIVEILFTVLHPLALIVSAVYTRMHNRGGHIALPPDHPDHLENGRRQGEGEGQNARGPREVDTDELWN
ncbi:hypothetical protein PLICRDRAFT_38586 [Plicaturopsis crispa FD-325 SS-3]|nr:hypothetical protein PLICRDRAFT_38586 [Plicaturopsis crispa FD-325 SS-3]